MRWGFITYLRSNTDFAVKEYKNRKTVVSREIKIRKRQFLFAFSGIVWYTDKVFAPETMSESVLRAGRWTALDVRVRKDSKL